jgi:hypothetical protein
VTGEEIKRNLVEFARRWSLYDGTERAEAQTFLNELFAAYGQDRYEVGARFEEAQAGRFLDLIWPRVCLVEMKRPSEAARLASHREQAMSYWRGAADPERNIPAPHFVVLCAFRRFEVWEPGEYPNAPRAEFDIVELPERLDALLFLAGQEPVFIGTQVAVTKDAVGLITDLYAALGERRAAAPDELRDFMLQCVWCMFAEDLSQLESHLFTHIVDELIAQPGRSSADDLGGLFEWLNRDGPRPAGGLYATTRYVNGALFRHPARVHLEPDELRVLRLACEYDWRKVEPHIFGSLLEGSLGRESQWALGAHYTHEVDIQKVIKPSIVDPWRERIEDAATLAQVQQLQNELLNYVVLDPACGSGNFLYIAYRELRRLENRLHQKERDLRLAQGRRRAAQGALTAFFPLTNIKGVEINAFAVALARVTLWMAHKLAVDELDLDEATLPLENLSGIQASDALRIAWPTASVIVGNPPFHGDRHLRGLLGDDYVQWLKDTFDCGIKDHCVYWFRKAQDHLEPGQRAGLVGTNSIHQNRARSASLDYIIDNGGVITDAVSSQDWPGDANVDVSIVNWIKGPEQQPSVVVLDGLEITEPIAASLRPWSAAVERAKPLAKNRGRAFFGPIPGASGFVLEPAEAQALLNGKPDSWQTVVRPYLVGDDLAKDPHQAPRRWIIDFGHRTLEEAARFPDALEIVRARVKPQRDKVRRATYRQNWWRFSEPLREMRSALAPLRRYVASPAQAKRILFSWVEPGVCPSNLVTVFAFEDDYSIGVLSSCAHRHWLEAGWSTLEDRLRYTPSTVFMTFPWPDPSPAQRAAIAKASAALYETRSRLCAEHKLGLTDLYNSMDEGGFQNLADRHAALDLAVIAAYGWTPGDVDTPHALNARLLARNLDIAARTTPYAGPG